MARIPKRVPTRRLNLEMTETVREKLETLREKTSADSLSEVIRRSLSFYELLVDEVRQGRNVVIRGPGSKERELVVLD